MAKDEDGEDDDDVSGYEIHTKNRSDKGNSTHQDAPMDAPIVRPANAEGENQTDGVEKVWAPRGDAIEGKSGGTLVNYQSGI